MAARISIVIGSSIIFNQIIDIPYVFADGDNPDVNEVFKDLQSNDGAIKNYIDGQLYNRLGISDSNLRKYMEVLLR